MYLLPGDYNFWFKNGSGWYGPVMISVGGCELSESYVLLRVVDENGHGVAGGRGERRHTAAAGIRPCRA